MWLFYTLLAALAVGLTDIARKAMLNELPFWLTIAALGWSTVIFLLFFFVRVMITEKRAGRKLFPNTMARRSTATAAFLNTVMLVMYMFALKLGPISIISPLRNTVPLFSLLLGYCILREHTGTREKTGIILSVVGLCVLVWSVGGTEERALPYIITALLLALGVAILSAVTLIASKYATNEKYGGVNVMVYSMTQHITMAVVYTIGVFMSGENFPALLYKPSLLLYIIIPIGALSALASWTLTKAISIGDTVRVSPVARLSVLVSVVAGGVWFMEDNLGLRVAATVLFLVGLLPVIIWQEKVKPCNFAPQTRTDQ